MMKTLLYGSTLMATLLVAATPASAYGVCVGVCTEVTYNETNTDVDIHTCAGNMAVQIGINNHAEFCSKHDPGGTDAQERGAGTGPVAPPTLD